MIFLAVIEYAILASTFTIAKVAVQYADPLFLIGVRMVLSAPIMFLIHRLQDKSGIKIKRRDYKVFFLAGIFHIFIPFIGEFWALQYVSSAKTAITYSLTPFIAAILSYFLLKKAISSKQMAGLAIGLLGLLPIFISGDDLSFGSEFLLVSVPELVLLGAVASASYGWFLVSALMKEGYGISLVNGMAMFIGGILSLVMWYVVSGQQAPISGNIEQFIFWTFLLIIVANVISYNFYAWLLRHMSITLMSAIGFLCPIFATIYGYFLLNEALTIWHLVALIMVGSGIWLFYREEMQEAAVRAIYEAKNVQALDETLT